MDDVYTRLMRKAGTLLARRTYSRGELREKLRPAGQASAIETVLDRLEELKLLNDDEYSYNFALCRMGQDGWGPAKVQSSLLRRRVDPATVDKALERVQSELSRAAILADYVKGYCRSKGIPSDLKTLRKLALHLGRRGFREEDISGVLRQIIPAALWQQFETGD